MAARWLCCRALGHGRQRTRACMLYGWPLKTLHSGDPQSRELWCPCRKAAARLLCGCTGTRGVRAGSAGKTCAGVGAGGWRAGSGWERRLQPCVARGATTRTHNRSFSLKLVFCRGRRGEQPRLQ